MTNSKNTVAVLGTGRMGRAIGLRLAEEGFIVIYGSRDPQREDVQLLLADTNEITACDSVATDISEATKLADWVVFATPYHAIKSVLQNAGALSGKLVIDITNALKMADDGLMEMASDTSAGEELQAAIPDAKAVKAFNTVGFHIVANPADAGGPVSVLVAGNDTDAKHMVCELITKLGFEAIDVGPMRQARFLEGMSALYLTPYLQGRVSDAFEYYLRSGSSPKKSKGVRSAG